ncbi:hypothetical protein TFLX_05036 [Thermoflexales bacterium]|nr:hypothetical protein TFLX_05036 [Thermoflexales bacterium]
MRMHIGRKKALGAVVLSLLLHVFLSTCVRGVVYECLDSHSRCNSQPAGGRTVYLLTGGQNGSKPTILQTTTTGPGGYFLFIGAPPSDYNVAAVVGEFQSGTVLDSSGPWHLYCAFAFHSEPSRLHTIYIGLPDQRQSFIRDFGNEWWGGLSPCPQ